MLRAVASRSFARKEVIFGVDRRPQLRFTRAVAGSMIHPPGICQVALLVHCIVISADRSFSGTCLVERRVDPSRLAATSARQRRDDPPSALLISAVLSMVMASVLSLMKQSRGPIEIGAADKIRRPPISAIAEKRMDLRLLNWRAKNEDNSITT